MNVPVIISVAPNGSSKTKEDHPNVPLHAEEIAREAKECNRAGATLIHLHVRDREGKHTLDPITYKNCIKAIRRSVGSNMVIQVTTESNDIYSPEQQMEAIYKLRPEAVSLAIREFVPAKSYENIFKSFLIWMAQEHVAPQFVVYSERELRYFYDMQERGVIPGNRHFLLFVLGRYNNAKISTPADLLPFINTYNSYDRERISKWAVCAFGKMEASCMLTAATLGGHVRIGFENNMHLADGSIAQNNAELVKQFVNFMPITNRTVSSIEDTKAAVIR